MRKRTWWVGIAVVIAAAITLKVLDVLASALCGQALAHWQSHGGP
jgi:hypothetical protein